MSSAEASPIFWRTILLAVRVEQLQESVQQKECHNDKSAGLMK